MLKRLFIRLALVLLLVPPWIFLRSVYRDRIGAFGCFDDCFNYMGGYFLLQGKRIFADFFYNHQPLAAYISFLVQKITQPESIYTLVYQHRMMLIYYSIIANIFLTLRFGLVGFIFSLLYEATKGFLFGERFLAEGIIVYPLVYLLGLSWYAATKKRIASAELFVAAVLTWFIVFLREPYVPVALVLFGYLLWQRKKETAVIFSIIVFAVLSIGTIVLNSPSDYFFNVVTINRQTIGASEASVNKLFGVGALQVFFYPMYILSKGSWNLFRHIEIGMTVVFLISNIFLWEKKKKFLIFLWIALGLANIRTGEPGSIYYAAFHLLIWWALFICATLFLLLEIIKQKKKVLDVILGACVIGLTIYAWFSPASYLHEKVDRQTEFVTGYAHYDVVGGVVKALATSGDTLFLDGLDDLIYWRAGIASAYRYNWYTSATSQFEKYRKARNQMFGEYPPTFYYGLCKGEELQSKVADSVLDQYSRLVAGDTPSCLFVHKNRISTITTDQWKAVEQYEYSPP